MSRKADFEERRQDFIEYLKGRGCPKEDTDDKLIMFDTDYTTELMCELTDAVCDIAKSMKAINEELGQIRRRILK